MLVRSNQLYVAKVINAGEFDAQINMCKIVPKHNEYMHACLSYGGDYY